MRDRGRPDPIHPTARRPRAAGDARLRTAGARATAARSATAVIAAVALACIALAGILGAVVGTDLSACPGCAPDRPAADGGRGDLLTPVGEREALGWAQTALVYQGSPSGLRCERGIDDLEWTCSGEVGFTRARADGTVDVVGWCGATVIVRRAGLASSGAHLSALAASACPRDVSSELRASDG